MRDSYQQEIPRARINITLDIETDGAKRQHELPLKLLILGDFLPNTPLPALVLRERVTIDKYNFSQVLAKMQPTLTIHAKEPTADFPPTPLCFQSMKDFHPQALVNQVPRLRQLLAMRNLLKDLKASLLDNKQLRQSINEFIGNESTRNSLRQDMQQCAPLLENNKQGENCDD